MVHAPAVGPIAFARGVRSRGFLDFAGDLWREHGDVFEAHVGPRRLVFVESHLLLAILARRFRPRLRDGFVPHFVMHGTLSIEGGLPAVIETR